MSMKERMPVLLIGYGSPMNKIATNNFTKSLVNLSGQLPKPDAILVVSVHWSTDGNYVTCTKNPRLYAFNGSP